MGFLFIYSVKSGSFQPGGEKKFKRKGLSDEFVIHHISSIDDPVCLTSYLAKYFPSTDTLSANSLGLNFFRWRFHEIYRLRTH